MIIRQARVWFTIYLFWSLCSQKNKKTKKFTVLDPNTIWSFFPVYAFLHFITIFCTPIVWVNGYAYLSEMWDPKWRYIFTVITGIPLGQSIMTLIAYFNRTWTGIHIWSGIATACTLIPWYIIPESPRWLAQNHQVEGSMTVLLKMAKINGKNISSEDEIKIRNILTRIAEKSHKTEDKLTPLDMFKHGQMIKSLILWLEHIP